MTTFKKALRYLLITLGVFLLLLSAFIFFIRIPVVQNYLTAQAIDFVSSKTKSAITLDRIYIGFFNSVVIEGLYVEDEKKDTLAHLGYAAVDIDVFSLMGKKINISMVELTNTTINLSTTKNSPDFNFQFIVDAFAGDSVAESTPKPETTSAPWTFGVKEVLLSDINFRYDDQYNGILAESNLAQLEVELNNLDLTNNQYDIKEILLSNTQTKIQLGKSFAPLDTSASKPAAFSLTAETIKVQNNEFTYADDMSKMNLAAKIGELTVGVEEIDLLQQMVNLSTIKLDQSSIQFTQNKNAEKNAQTNGSEVDAAQSNDDWQVKLAELFIDSTKFKYDDHNSAPIPKGMDFSHLGINLQEVDMDSIRYHGLTDILFGVNQLMVTEQSGFGLTNTQLNFSLSEHDLSIENLNIQSTNGSRINHFIALHFESLEKIAEPIEELGVDIDLEQSSISLKDIKFFSPELFTNEYLANLLDEQIDVSIAIKGQVKELGIERLNLAVLNQTNLKLHGTLKDITNLASLQAAIYIDEVKTSRNNLQQLLPENTLPSSLTFPTSISLSGEAMGSLDQFNSQFNLATSLGNLALTAQIKDGAKDLDSLNYLVDINSNQLNIKELLNDTSFNTVKLAAKLQGRGVNPKQMNISAEASVEELDYRRYRYAPYQLQAQYNNETLSWTSSIRDTNLIFDLNGAITLADAASNYNVDLNLVGADFQLLNLTEDDTRLKLKLNADLTGNTIDNMVGKLDMRGFQILRNDEIYQVDSLLFVSFKDSSTTNIQLNSDIISGFFKGNIQLSTLGTSMTDFFKGYYDDSLKMQLKEDNQSFSFDLKLVNNPLIKEVLLTDLEEFEDSYINGEFSAEDNFFEVNASFPKTVYGGINMDSLQFFAYANGKNLDYQLSIKNLSQGEFLLKRLSILGNTKADTLFTKVIQKEVDQPASYLIAAKSFEKDGQIRLAFSEDSAILNKNKWEIASNSFVEFGERLLIDLSMYHDGEELSLRNDSANTNLLNLDFKRFKIQNLVNLIKSAEADSIRIVSGKLSGKSQVNLQTNNVGFEADLTLTDLKLFEESIGDININTNKVKDVYKMAASLSGNDNDVRIEGSYSEREALDIKANIKQLSIPTIAAFTDGQLKRSSGNVSGNFNMNGTVNEPDISGTLNFVDVKFYSPYLNTKYTLKNERIEIANRKLEFKQFTVLDSIGNNFKVGGSISLNNFENLAYDVTIKSKNFQALNTTKEDKNDLFYGKVLFSSDITLKGDMNKPIVNAKLKLNRGTDFTFVLPESDPSEVSQEGVIVFVDKNQQLSDIFSREKKTDTVKADITGVDVVAQIEIDEATNLNIIIDPIAGDKLTLKGGGTLNSQIDPSGNISLTGRYTINDGKYNLTLYDLVKRDFLIEQGSSITWTGDPLKADLDISAIYEVKTSPIDLLSNQSGSLTESERLAYQEQLPFLVSLNMDDELMSPTISFDIDLEDDKKGALNGLVYAKLQELNQSENELNKQVFTLIILNRFISTGNFTNQSDGANMARSSVSKIMNQQLNRLSDKYIKGVNLELNLDSYEGYNAEQGDFEGRTELNLAVSKSFLNERIAVKVGGDLDLEGERARQNTISDFAGDVSIEYMITPDGRYKAKLYRDNRFEGVLEGDIIETGVSLIYNRDYDTVKELFRKPEELKLERDEE